MIVITGPGRSGTSLLALLYKELGFDPGGDWSEHVNAGFEDGEVFGVNDEIIAALGMQMLGTRGEVAVPFRRAFKTLLPAPLRRALRNGMNRHRPQGHLDYVRWTKVPYIVETLGDRLVAAASSREVVKDPRFCLTLPVWLAAGAKIDHVVATVRPSATSAASRSVAGHNGFTNDDLLRSAIVLTLGSLIDTLITYDVAHTVLKFPDWTEQADRLAAELPFPRSVPPGAIEEALARITRPDLIHHTAPGPALPARVRSPAQRVTPLRRVE